MEFTGQYSIPGPPAPVWAALHDPDILAACIPGCESVTKVSDTEFQVALKVKIGPVQARFTGNATWEDHAPPPGFTHAGTIGGQGQGGPAGFARGESEVMLAVAGKETILSYRASAVIGGKLAQIGQRLIDSTAKSLADAFFGKFDALMQGAVAEAPAVTPEAPAAAPQPEPGEEGLAPQIWVVGLIATIIILLIVFGLVL